MGVGGMFPQVSTDPEAQAFAKHVLEHSKIQADNFALAYRDALYLLKGIVEKVGCDRTAIRDQLRATWEFNLETAVDRFAPHATGRPCWMLCPPTPSPPGCERYTPDCAAIEPADRVTPPGRNGPAFARHKLAASAPTPS